MFKKVLIANRGEIALRIIRSCKELGIKTVAIHSEADANSLHVRFADEDVCIGPPPSTESYLNVPRIVSAAEVTNAEAIHPGYGFLAENPNFAEICESCGIKFIGPPSDVIRKLGDKVFARNIMGRSGISVLPGSKESVTDFKEASKIAGEIGYPVILKATLGGGGKGMRIAYDKKSLGDFFTIARAEAGAAFGDPRIYIEKYMERPRHIEFQILGDNFGNVVHLGERECSIQRRHQKLIEESPSVIMNDGLRKKMGKLVVKGASDLGYRSAGTMEFLVDAQMNFYFCEMNTRIQVEHPVTEFVTGVDIVKEQIKIAAGERLNTRQKDIHIKGHAIECRINAEDPQKGFIPCAGKVKGFHIPGGFGVRVDTHVYAEYEIPPYYDSMIGKVIVYGDTREEAIARMKRTLEEFYIDGVKTTVPFHLSLIGNDKFKKGEFDTGFVERMGVQL